MPRRFPKTLWLLCALLMLAQSLLPASAIAFVSVRCIGAPANAPACAQSMMPAADTMVAGTHRATMSCCQHMGSNCMMIARMAAMAPPPSSSVSPATCLVTVKTLSTERVMSTTNVRQWMLNASPALAPPAAPSVLPVVCKSTLPLPVRAFDLPHSPSIHSHGLRAPPVS